MGKLYHCSAKTYIDEHRLISMYIKPRLYAKFIHMAERGCEPGKAYNLLSGIWLKRLELNFTSHTFKVRRRSRPRGKKAANRLLRNGAGTAVYSIQDLRLGWSQRNTYPMLLWSFTKYPSSVIPLVCLNIMAPVPVYPFLIQFRIYIAR